MINIVKGTGQTLQQSDYTVAKGSDTIVAGMVCNVIGSTLRKGAYASSADNAVDLYGAYQTQVFGFALNGTADGDVVASGKISLLLMDGNSVVETDQLETGKTWTVGLPVYAEPTTGYITTDKDAHGAYIGICLGTRSYHVGALGDGTTVGTADSNGIKQPMATTVVAVKLHSTAPVYHS